MKRFRLGDPATAGEPVEPELVSPFEVLEPERLETSLILCSPHSGRIYPARFLKLARLDAQALRQSEDAFVDDLLAQAVAAGSHDVENRLRPGFSGNRRRDGFLPQRAGEGGNFSGRLALMSQSGQKIGFELHGDGGGDEPVHSEPYLSVVQRMGGEEMLDEFFEHAGILGLKAAGSN